MGRLTCRCLNVAVHYKGDSWNARPLDGGKVLPSACSHRLCAATLYEIDLDLAGVTTVSRVCACMCVGICTMYVCSMYVCSMYVCWYMYKYVCVYVLKSQGFLNLWCILLRADLWVKINLFCMYQLINHSLQL